MRLGVRSGPVRSRHRRGTVAGGRWLSEPAQTRARLDVLALKLSHQLTGRLHAVDGADALAAAPECPSGLGRRRQGR